MLVSDRTFWKYLKKGDLDIKPLVAEHVQPASVDLTLGNTLLILGNHMEVEVKDGYTVLPGEFLLASTYEEIYVSPRFAGRVEGKSSLGRLGLLVHVTAGFIDPGFRGKITLELANLSKEPVKLRPNQKICQITFLHMDKKVARPYGSKGLGSKYQGQDTVTGAR
jgi:dCTP deaminase